MVVIVGAGLHGASVALALLQRGASVTLIERGVPGAEASTAAAGILAPRCEAAAHPGPAEALGFGLESLAMYPAWASALGVSLHLEGSINEGVVHAGEGWVEPKELVPAALAAARRGGAKVVRAEVVGCDASGVTTKDGEMPGTVVVCAGAWTGLVPGLGRGLEGAGMPVRPVRGQIVMLRGEVDRVTFGRTAAGSGYLVPRMPDAFGPRLLVGATVEEVGFLRGVTEAGVRGLREIAEGLQPGLGSAEVLAAWSGFRPGTPDGLPIVGEHRGVWFATGHYRNGILLAPWSARLLADAIDGHRIDPALVPARFA